MVAKTPQIDRNPDDKKLVNNRTDVASKLTNVVVLFGTTFILVLLTQALIQPSSEKKPRGEDQHAAPEKSQEHDIHGVTEHLDILADVASHAFQKYGWMVVILIAVTLIKVLLVGESLGEVVACWLDLLAFLLSHTVSIVRYVAYGLRRLAKDLRERNRK